MIRLLAEPGFRRRMFFIGGNFAALIVLLTVIVMPIFKMFAERDARIEQQAKRLARLTSIAEEAGRVQSIASEAKAEMQAGEFLTGANENVITAELQTKLRAITEAVGSRSRAIQGLPVKTIDQFRLAGVRIDIFGPVQSIARAVYAIESAKPYLFISAASLRTAPVARPGIEEPVIQAQLDVFGVIQTGAQP